MFHFFRMGNRAARNQFLTAMIISIVAIVVTRNPAVLREERGINPLTMAE